MRAFAVRFALILAFAVGLAAPVWAAPSFPALSGRVVDEADVLSSGTREALTSELAGLETKTGRQLVVVTLKSLQGQEIEDYGYQLGRAWGIGAKGQNNGALFIIAPSERKVRIEVGYGLEGVLTDALSSAILQGKVLPRFKAGDMEGGIKAGTDAIVEQLGLDPASAEARVKAATTPARQRGSPDIRSIIFIIIFVIWGLSALGRTRGRSGMGGALWPLIFLGGMGGRNDDRWGGGGWGGGGGGGGFSGGGGSFGGGGSSGSW